MESKVLGIPLVLIVVVMTIISPILVVMLGFHITTVTKLNRIEQVLVPQEVPLELEATPSAEVTPTPQPTEKPKSNEMIRKVTPVAVPVPEASNSTR